MGVILTGQRPLRLGQLVRLGYTLHELEHCPADALLGTSDTEPGPPGVIERLDNLMYDLEQLELMDTDGLARMTVRPLIFRLQRAHARGERQLGGYAAELHRVLRDLSAALHREAFEMYTYPVRPITAFLVERLVDEPSRLFSVPDVLEPPLPTRVDDVVREAGRCLAVGFEAAALLFILQATELIVGYYYERVTGRAPRHKSSVRPMAWGAMNSALARPEYACPSSLISDLKHIVRDYRNPAMHGRLELTEGIAVKVWALCSDAVYQMIDDLVGRRLITIGE